MLPIFVSRRLESRNVGGPYRTRSTRQFASRLRKTSLTDPLVHRQCSAFTPTINRPIGPDMLRAPASPDTGRLLAGDTVEKAGHRAVLEDLLDRPGNHRRDREDSDFVDAALGRHR